MSNSGNSASMYLIVSWNVDEGNGVKGKKHVKTLQEKGKPADAKTGQSLPTKKNTKDPE